MGKYGRCQSMPSTSSSWTTRRESLPGEAWPLHLRVQSPEKGPRGHTPGDLVGEKVGNRARKETWRRTKREDVQRRDEGDIGLAGGPQSPVSLLLSDTPDPYFSSFSSPWVSGWKCCKCDMRENLWLNLTDGSILCGRRYFDGSGGNNHAVEHYRETGYPLAVKLGTITPDGAGTPSLPPAISVLKYV